MSRTLIAPMVEQTTAFLSDLLPVTDVTEVEVSNAEARQVELPTRIQDYHARSAVGQVEAEAQTFVLVPDTDSGKSFATVVKRTVPSALTIAVNGTATNLMFCQEHGNLRADEVAALVGGVPTGVLSIAGQPADNTARAFRRNRMAAAGGGEYR